MLNGPKPSLAESNRREAAQDGQEPAMPAHSRVLLNGAMLALAALIVSACASQAGKTVQVVDRTTPANRSAATVPATAGRESSRIADGETYTVKRGDTLYQIALDHGQDWRDIAQWNNLDDPNHLNVGQVLRVDRGQGSASAASRPVESGPAQTAPVAGPAPSATRPLDAPLPPLVPPAAPAPSVVAPSTVPAPAASKPPAAPVKPDAPGERVDWAWPASGKIIESFSDSRNKGLDIAGTPGDPVLAAGDGKVVYSGNGLRGYGNLIIIKHNNTYLSAYAHNRSMLIKEGQAVRRGQKIAELGQTDAESPRLHFEIRRLGKPVDPADYLPQR